MQQLSITVVLVQVNETLMRSIVTGHDSDYIGVTDFDQLDEHVDNLVHLICTKPPLTESTVYSFYHTTAVLNKCVAWWRND